MNFNNIYIEGKKIDIRVIPPENSIFGRHQKPLFLSGASLWGILRQDQNMLFLPSNFATSTAFYFRIVILYNDYHQIYYICRDDLRQFLLHCDEIKEKETHNWLKEGF